MPKEQEEAIKYLEFMNGTLDFNKMGYVYAKESIKTILNLIETQKQEIKNCHLIIEQLNKTIDEEM